jgi:hypothetical protein
MGPGGPIDDHADPDVDESTYNNALKLPGARRGDNGSRRSKVEVLTMAVDFPLLAVNGRQSRARACTSTN